MSRIAFLGLGNMGAPMAANLVKAGHTVHGFDLVEAAKQAAAGAGVSIAPSAREAVAAAETVITMLPGRQARARQLRRTSCQPHRRARWSSTARPSMSTAPGARTRPAPRRACRRSTRPVSGGVGGATAGTLTFMCGGSPEAFARGEADPRGDGQAHRPLRRRGSRAGGQDLQQHDPRRDDDRDLRGLRARRKARPRSAQALFDVASTSSGQWWSLTSYCPVPGPGSGVARQSRLQARLRREPHAQGSASSPRRRRRASAPRPRSGPKRRSSTPCSWPPATAATTSPA